MYINQLSFSLIEGACTHQCPWCFFYNKEDSRGRDVLGLDMIQTFCDLNKGISLPVRVLPPGEPLLHPQLFEIIETFNHNNFPVNGFYSNLSVPMSDEQIQIIAKIDGSLVFNMSFFEGEEKLRDIAVTNFRRLHNAILVHQKHDPTFQPFVQVGINKSPIKTLELGLEDITDIIYPNVLIVNDEFLDHSFPPNDAAAMKQRFHTFYDKFKNLDANKYLYELPKATCNLRTLAVANNGSYLPCCSPLTPPNWVLRYDFSQSNVFLMPLQEIEQSVTFKAIIKDRTEGELFPMCRECNGLSIPQYIPWEV